MSRYSSRVIPVSELGPRMRRDMLRLMESSYTNTAKESFLCDLRAKQYVLLLELDDQLQGFSTIESYEVTWCDKKRNIVFSGDTVVQASLRHSSLLWSSFGKWMLEYSQDKELYWFLISKSFRTYRYLTQNFKYFYPSQENNSEELKDFAKFLAHKKYPNSFCENKMLVLAGPNAQALQVTERPPFRASSDECFYQSLNPQHSNGDELVCLVRFDRENLQDRIQKRLCVQV